MLNNRAYYETLAGSLEEALVWSTKLQELADRHGLPMRVGRLDTIGRVLMELGRLEDAEDGDAARAAPGGLQASLDGDAGADFLLTLAEIRRRRGHLDGAQESLDECVRRCDQFGLTSIRVRARREQSELHAARRGLPGRLRGATSLLRRAAWTCSRPSGTPAPGRCRRCTRPPRRAGRPAATGSCRCGTPSPASTTGASSTTSCRACSARRRRAGPVTVALLDLDHFKRVNDTCSHEVGDRVLCAVAELLQDAASSAGAGGSFAARMGGEEFLLVLVGPDAAAAARRLEDVRRSGPHPSLGRADRRRAGHGQRRSGQLRRRTDTTVAELFGRADGHLYLAKRAGRDRVVSDAT